MPPSEFARRTVAAYQQKIGPGLSANDGAALQDFCRRFPDADPVYGEQAVLEAARAGKRGMAYTLAIASRLMNEAEAERIAPQLHTDEQLAAYAARRRERYITAAALLDKPERKVWYEIRGLPVPKDARQ